MTTGLHSSLTAANCVDNHGYEGMQPEAWGKENPSAEKELQESMDRCTGHRDIT